MKVFANDKLVTIQVIYYMPDYQQLVNEFVWQTQDTIPKYPRSERFIRFWHTNIDAVIKEAFLLVSNVKPLSFWMRFSTLVISDSKVFSSEIILYIIVS